MLQQERAGAAGHVECMLVEQRKQVVGRKAVGQQRCQRTLMSSWAWWNQMLISGRTRRMNADAAWDSGSDSGPGPE